MNVKKMLIILVCLFGLCFSAHADDRCTLPPEVGPCDAVFLRWFHDAASGQCRHFQWGGCGGNANNFLSHLQCQQACLTP
ncbi:PI-actitoxin-Afv2b-like [Babylonia areolata]|uniref:PI-actitoxin-Afv2b-like n=1 Tax=Babylonia areolata TaxID=304850 RepID=UPI003FD005A2